MGGIPRPNEFERGWNAARKHIEERMSAMLATQGPTTQKVLREVATKLHLALVEPKDSWAPPPDAPVMLLFEGRWIRGKVWTHGNTGDFFNARATSRKLRHYIFSRWRKDEGLNWRRVNQKKGKAK